MSSTLCLSAGAALATLILACKRVLRQLCQSCQSISQSSRRCLRHSLSLALINSHTGRRSGRHRLDSALPHVQLKYFDRLSSPIVATTPPPPPSTRQRNGYSAAPPEHHLSHETLQHGYFSQLAERRPELLHPAASAIQPTTEDLR